MTPPGAQPEPALRNTCDWSFFAGIIACDGWLVMALFKQYSLLTEALTSHYQIAEAGTDRCPPCFPL